MGTGPGSTGKDPEWVDEVAEHGPLVRLVAAMLKDPETPPSPDLVAEAERDAKRRRLLKTVPPNTIGVHLVNLGELLLLRRRRDFQDALKTADQEVGELHKRRLSINLRVAMFADTLLDWLASMCALIPGTLAFLLHAAPIRTRKHRYPWMLVSLAVIGGVWFLPCPWWVAAPFALLFSLLLILLFVAGQFSNAEQFEDQLQEIIASLTAKRDVLLEQRSLVSDTMKAFLDNPEENLEDKIDQPVLEEVQGKVDEDIASLKRVRKDYERDAEALRYLDMIASSTNALAVRRAEARFACEREEIAIERRMAAKRWSSTVMAMSISKGSTLVRMFILVFTLLLIPVVVAVVKGGGSTPAVESAPVTESESTLSEELPPLGERKVNIRTIGRYGLMIVVGGIVSLFLAWTITFLLRIVPRHIQMTRAAKQAVIDSLINDYEWHKVQIRLFERLLIGMEQAAALLGGELTPADQNMVRRDTLESEREIRMISRRLERLTKKSWSPRAKGSKHQGGVVDSGAPEDLADAALIDLLP